MVEKTYQLAPYWGISNASYHLALFWFLDLFGLFKTFFLKTINIANA